MRSPPHIPPMGRFLLLSAQHLFVLAIKVPLACRSCPPDGGAVKLTMPSCSGGSLPPGEHSQGNSSARKRYLHISYHVLLQLDCAQGPGFDSKISMQGFKWDDRKIGWTKPLTMGTPLGSLNQCFGLWWKPRIVCLRENSSTGVKIMCL